LTALVEKLRHIYAKSDNFGEIAGLSWQIQARLRREIRGFRCKRAAFRAQFEFFWTKNAYFCENFIVFDRFFKRQEIGRRNGESACSDLISGGARRAGEAISQAREYVSCPPIDP
jgi:hypothetical protein